MQDFANTYARMADEQLLSIYLDIDSLIAEAKTFLLVELRKRKLGEFQEGSDKILDVESTEPIVGAFSTGAAAKSAWDSVPKRTAQFAPSESQPREQIIEDRIAERYTDAYLVAGSTVMVGRIIKIVGLILGGLIVVVSIGILSEMKGGVLGAVLAGALLWFGFYFVGVLVSAQGQILQAALDGAVNTSPLIDNPRRIKIMSLE